VRPQAAIIILPPPGLEVVPQHPTRLNAPRGPFNSPDEAAIAWSEYILSTSIYIRHEHGAVIYRRTVRHGFLWLKTRTEYRITQTISGNPHSINLTATFLSTNGTSVATIHTHPNSHRFSGSDLRNARRRRVDAYVATPATYQSITNFHLLRYDRSSSETTVVETFRQRGLRRLSTDERRDLETWYRRSWERHLASCSGFGCNNEGRWPTNPWP